MSYVVVGAEDPYAWFKAATSGASIEELPDTPVEAEIMDYINRIAETWSRRHREVSAKAALEAITKTALIAKDANDKVNWAIEKYKSYPGDWTVFLRNLKTQIYNKSLALDAERKRIAAALAAGRQSVDSGRAKDAVLEVLHAAKSIHGTIANVSKKAQIRYVPDFMMNALGDILRAIQALQDFIADLPKKPGTWVVVGALIIAGAIYLRR